MDKGGASEETINMKIQFAALYANPHTRWAVAIYTITKVGLRICEIWFASYSVNLRLTADVIESAAIMYGITSAGAGNVPLAQTGDEIKLRHAQDQMSSSRWNDPGPNF